PAEVKFRKLSRRDNLPRSTGNYSPFAAYPAKSRDRSSGSINYLYLRGYCRTLQPNGGRWTSPPVYREEAKFSTGKASQQAPLRWPLRCGRKETRNKYSEAQRRAWERHAARYGGRSPHRGLELELDGSPARKIHIFKYFSHGPQSPRHAALPPTACYPLRTYYLPAGKLGQRTRRVQWRDGGAVTRPEDSIFSSKFSVADFEPINQTDQSRGAASRSGSPYRNSLAYRVQACVTPRTWFSEELLWTEEDVSRPVCFFSEYPLRLARVMVVHQTNSGSFYEASSVWRWLAAAAAAATAVAG
ncbi:hypothetical protein ALC62_08816, partial [Cyphomyrmex costatus]